MTAKTTRTALGRGLAATTVEKSKPAPARGPTAPTAERSRPAPARPLTAPTVERSKPAPPRELSAVPVGSNRPASVSRGPLGERRGEVEAAGHETRKYPRAPLQVKVKLSLSGDRSKSFEASLATTNISVGGLFLESTFFLKIGTLLDVELELPPHHRHVKARGQVVRIESYSADPAGKTGFALRFIEYLDGSEVVLATHFLAPILREFIADYARQHRMRASEDYVNQTADVLAAWELRKAELGSDVWEFQPPQQPRRK